MVGSQKLTKWGKENGLPLLTGHWWGEKAVYHPVLPGAVGQAGLSGAPGAIRTHNRRIRSPVLYPLSYGGGTQLYCKDLGGSILKQRSNAFIDSPTREHAQDRPCGAVKDLAQFFGREGCVSVR